MATAQTAVPLAPAARADLAAAIKEEQVSDAVDALGQAIAASTPSEKNAGSSTPKPSPASS